MPWCVQRKPVPSKHSMAGCLGIGGGDPHGAAGLEVLAKASKRLRWVVDVLDHVVQRDRVVCAVLRRELVAGSNTCVDSCLACSSDRRRIRIDPFNAPPELAEEHEEAAVAAPYVQDPSPCSR